MAPVHVELQTLHASIDIRNAKHRWQTRTSLRLILEDDQGRRGFGEAAPLPGLSKETVRDVRRALRTVKWPSKAPVEREAIAAIVATIAPSLPSARFAAETALLSLAATIRRTPLYAMWTDDVEAIPLAGVLWGDTDQEVLQSAHEARAASMQAVKVKVGKGSIRGDLDLLHRVREIVGPIELRLDANGSLLPAGLAERLESLSELDPAFIEEPSTLEAFLALDSSPIPFALDESLATMDDDAIEELLGRDTIGALVLKPTLLGGLERVLRIARMALQAMKPAVISHTLEGVIARSALAHLALVVGGTTAAGLGEHPALHPLSRGLITPWIELDSIEPPAAVGLGLELGW